jgi:hypothetical protein
MVAISLLTPIPGRVACFFHIGAAKQRNGCQANKWLLVVQLYWPTFQPHKANLFLFCEDALAGGSSLTPQGFSI